MTIIIGITIQLLFASFGDVFMVFWDFWFVELHVNLFEQQGEFNSEDDDDDDDDDADDDEENVLTLSKDSLVEKAMFRPPLISFSASETTSRNFLFHSLATSKRSTLQ